MATALAQAAATGKPVAVDAATTASHTLAAEPNGTFTSVDSLLPVRVRQNGHWVALNTKLVQGSDGHYRPVAASNPISLSGGGSGPLATVSDADGHRLSYTFPFPLPSPQVSGDTALYPSVLPGIDLSVSVTDQGGFSEVLVVHNATAAADPRLKTLSVATAATGLKLSADQHGDLAATTADGKLAFSAPRPLMWDSSHTASAAQPNGVRTGLARTSATTGDTSGQGDDPASSPAGPGRGARVYPVGMKVNADNVTLTPDTAALTGPDTVYPVYIDPYTNPASAASGSYDEVYSNGACATSPQYDKPQTDGEGVGYNQWGGACGNGLERSFYTLPISGMPTNAVVEKSLVSADDTYAASWNCSQNQSITLHTTGTINSGTDWNNQPGTLDSSYAAVSTSVPSGSNPNSSCSNKTASFTVTSQVQKLVTAGASNWTVGLRGNESETSGNVDFLRFSTKITITTNFDVPPNTPTGTVSTPVPVNPSGPDCDNSGAGWIGASGAQSIALSANVSTPMSGVNVAGEFSVWDDNTANSTGGATEMGYVTSPYLASGTTARMGVGFTPKDGHFYGWDVWAKDDTSLHLTSGTTAPCHFKYDGTAPETPVVSTSDPSFPPVGSGAPNPVKYAGTGTTMSIKVTAADPLPAASCTLGAVSGTTNGCPASGVAKFLYKMDGTPTVADNDGSVTAAAAGADPNGNPLAGATITVPVVTWGVHTLYALAEDAAGNLSQDATTYTFSAPWNPATKYQYGDITGDQVPDLVATTKTGDLELVPGDTDPAQAADPSTSGYTGASSYTGPVLLSTAARAPRSTNGGGDTWSNYQIAHRGNLYGQQVDDLFALNTKTSPHQLYLVQNDLDPYADGPQPTVAGFTLNRAAPLAKPACQAAAPAARCGGAGYHGTDWGQTTQIAAPGDVYGTGKPALITVENGQLWIYEGVSGGSLTNPILLGDGDWTGLTLVTPGTVGGNPVLWVRDTQSGSVYTYDIKVDSTTGLPPLLHAPVRTTMQSAVVSTSGGKLCADDSKALNTPGNAIQMWGCNGTGAQSFTFRSNDNTVQVEGECLTPHGDGTAGGTLVEIDDCSSGDGAQQWTAGPNGSLVNSKSGLCLDDPNSTNTGGNQLQIYTCNGTNAQNWGGAVGGSLPTGNAQTKLGLHLTSLGYPMVASPGDINAGSGGGPDGNPDLYTVDGQGRLWEHVSTAPSGDYANFGGSVDLGQITDTAAHTWKLGEGSGTTASDTTAGLDATLNGPAAWASDSTRGSVLGLDGTTGYAATSGPGVNTSASFTVSAWVKLNSLAANSTFVSQSDDPTVGAANGFQLYYSSMAKAWAFDRHNDDTTGSSFSAVYGPTNVVAGQWTHLLGVYDASTSELSLYVNGHLAGTSAYTGTTWNAAGPVQIGRRLYEGSYGEYANGQVSDIRLYTAALSASDAAAPGDYPTVISLENSTS